jgi:hypothetical protein
MKKNQLGAAAPDVNNPLFDGVEACSPARVRLGRFLLNARALGNRVAERYAERLFWTHVVGPANVEREVAAQVLKRDEFQNMTPLQATEWFCKLLHEEVVRFDDLPAIKPVLFENSARTINQIWHVRQLADVNRLDYEVFIPRLVAIVARHAHPKARVEAVDLPRYGKDLAERLGTMH